MLSLKWAESTDATSDLTFDFGTLPAIFHGAVYIVARFALGEKFFPVTAIYGHSWDVYR